MKVTPKPKNSQEHIEFSELDGGEVFLHNGRLFIASNCDRQECIDLETGEHLAEMCGQAVMLVDATLTWKYKPTKTKKK